MGFHRVPKNKPDLKRVEDKEVGYFFEIKVQDIEMKELGYTFASVPHDLLMNPCEKLLYIRFISHSKKYF